MTASSSTRRALVLGASGGIGRAIVTRLVGEGWHVTGVGRSEAKLAALHAEVSAVEGGSGRLHPLAVDLDTQEGHVSLMSACRSPDVLISALGVAHPEPFLSSDPARWRAMYETNVISVMRVAQAVARSMAERGAGTLVFVGSGQSHGVAANSVAYAATKHALDAFVRGLRIELGPLGIRVAQVSPGYTSGTDFHRNNTHPELQGFSQRPYEGVGPADIASAVAMVLSTPETLDFPNIELRPRGQFYPN